MAPVLRVCSVRWNRKELMPREDYTRPCGAKVLPTHHVAVSRACHHRSRGVRRGWHGGGCRGGTVVLEHHDLDLRRQCKTRI